MKMDGATPDGRGKVEVGVSCCFDAPVMSPEEVFFKQRTKEIEDEDK